MQKTALSTLLLSVALAAAGARVAYAQADAQPDINNVLLLVDTSGSMEYRSSSTTFPTCTPTGGTNQRSRWIELIEAMTGSIENYRCDRVDRSSAAFKTEYTLGGITPYDYQYINPFHRPLSGTCAVGPGTLDSNPFLFPASAIKYHAYNSAGTTCSNFTQANDGLLDSFRAGTRFSLMTFDTLTDAGTGYSGTSAVPKTGMDGGFSYYLTSPKRGKPAACQVLQDMEVGVRNASAPPWEGRLVPFGDPYANEGQMLDTNEQIQKVLLTSRPYGATPIAGMLHDARDFLWNDTSQNPQNTAIKFGPRDDPFISGGCRRNIVLLLTDGEPNLDLRPDCEGTGAAGDTTDDGVCPYEKPEDIAAALLNPSGTNASRPPVEVHVIGFAVSEVNVGGQLLNCKNLTEDDLTKPSGACAKYPDDRGLQACCTLDRIAFNGWEGPNGEHQTAYFVSTQEELRLAIQRVLSTQSSTTSRTLPALASGSSAGGGINGAYRFFSSFKADAVDMWHGVIERQRTLCQPNTEGENVPVVQDFDPQKGDDFVANVNSGDPGTRIIYSVVGDVSGTKIYSQRSIRPQLSSNDGAGLYSGAQLGKTAQNFSSNLPAAAMSIDDTTCLGLGATACRDKFMTWQLGIGGSSRCPVPGNLLKCNLIADVYHSSPQVIGRPQSFLRDESYQRFNVAQQTRPLVLYVSTNDGFLHAFKVAPGKSSDPDVNSLKNNELWAFMPPAVLPSVSAQYPAIRQQLLDGTPVVRDVPAILEGGVYRYRRTQTEAQIDDDVSTGSPVPAWRTVLVQGFGSGRGGYFALDITNPEPDLTDATKGPRFLWQLTADSTGTALFGQGGGTPLITTLSYDGDGDGKPTEVAVAILPGGSGGAPAGECSRKNPTPANVDTSFPPREKIPCYPTAGGSRSLTIVQLDSGEILRTFRQSTSDAPAGLSGRVTLAPIDSPIVGQPVAYPADPGAAADRIFVGDSDGTLWKVDVSSIDPTKWSMSLFFDAYPKAFHAYNDGHPITTAPIISVDTLGNLTVALATGDQEILVATPGMVNYVWSLKELLNDNGAGYHSTAQWYTKLVGGERTTGPLTLFNGRLFFSTFLPQTDSSSPCNGGTSSVYGMHYITPKEVNDKSKGGLPGLPDPTDSFKLKQSVAAGTLLGTSANDPRATIFGVAVAQQPTCSTTNEDFSDPYLGYKSHTAIDQLNTGNFELVMHTGRGGSGVKGGSETNVLTIPLPTPMQPARVDSWAAIVE